MSCQGCGKNGMVDFVHFTPCKVCEILDKDMSNKWCAWCNECCAHICQDDWDNKIRRGAAAVITAFKQCAENFKKLIKR